MSETTAKRPKGLGDLYSGDHRAMKRREWRGVKDTMYDYWRWLKLLAMLGGKLGPVSVQLVKALKRYRWMMSYLTTPAFVDRHTVGLRGYELRYTHEQFFALLQNSAAMVRDLLERDAHLNPKSQKAAALREKTVIFDEMMPFQLMAGFPTLKGIPLQMIPIFEAGEVDQQANMYYIDAIEHFGLASDVCPLPGAECGCAVVDDYPDAGKLFISSTMPCDGSVVSTMYMERYFRHLDCYQITPPQRFNEDQVQEYAVKNLKGAIRFIEEHMGVTFDWDAYFKVMARHNEETKFMLDKWDINCTSYPQICGAGLALHREYEFQIASSLDDYFVKADRRVNRMMLKGYERDKALDNKARYRAIVWSCPAHYYPSVSFALMTGSEALVPRDETLVYGPDLPTLRKDTPFARVTLVRTDDIQAAGEQAAYEIMKGIELKKYDAAPRGYMVRASALTWREQVRVSKDAVRGGLTFAGVGALLAKTYHENPHVKAVKVIFITLPDGPYAPLERLASQSEERKKALNHVLADLKMDCRACEWKPVCDEVDGMKEMHQKYIREQNNGRESL